MVSVGGKNVKLEILPVGNLLPHEETSTPLLAELVRRIRKERLQRDPIIVEMEDMVVLDGMHRLEALKRLGLTHAVCSLVDYTQEGVRLLRWSRSVRNPTEGLAARLKTELGLSTRVSLEDAMKMLQSGETNSTLVQKSAAFVRDLAVARGSAMETVKRFDEIVADEAKTEFIDELSLQRVLRESDRLVLLTPKLDKRRVIEAAKKSELLPHKTTMHLLDVRPMGVNFPITRLSEHLPPSALESFLEGRDKKIIEPPANHVGRVYADKLLVLS